MEIRINENALSKIKSNLSETRDSQIKEGLILEQNSRKELIFNENFRNNQNYVLGRDEKINKILHLVLYNKNDTIGCFMFNFPRFLLLFYRKLKLNMELSFFAYFLSAIFFIYLFILYSPLLYSHFIVFTPIVIWGFFMPLLSIKKHKNYFVHKYMVNIKWNNSFDRFKRKSIWISNNYFIYSKKNINEIMIYDLLIKDRIRGNEGRFIKKSDFYIDENDYYKPTI